MSSCSSRGRGEEGITGDALCLQVQLQHRNEERNQPGDPQEMGRVPGPKADCPARMGLSEEEKLKVKLWEVGRAEL